MNTGISTFSSTQLPARNRIAFGGPSGYQRLRPIGMGHRIGQPETVSASPMSWTRAPSTIGSPSHRYSWPGAVNSQSAPLPGLSRTPARIHALVAPSSHTRTSLETRAARHSRPSTASTMWTKRIAEHRPAAADDRQRRGAGADQDRPQPGVGQRAVAAGAARVARLLRRLVDGVRQLVDDLRTATREIGPKARDIVAALWSRSGASAAPAQISAPTTRTGQGIGWPAAAAAAPTPSQAAAPDSECAGPIMVVPRPIARCAAVQLTGGCTARRDPSVAAGSSSAAAGSRIRARKPGKMGA